MSADRRHARMKLDGPRPPARLVTFWPLVWATYFMVSGGPYGLEELVAKAGYTGAVIALVVTPAVWSLPTALLVGELAAALPEEGGYYAWVKRALGPFWGFQEAWLSLAASVFDMAIYPTLFCLYLGKLVPAVGTPVGTIVVGSALVAACTAYNLRGAGSVGRTTLALAVLLLAPFVAFVVLALVGRHAATPAPTSPPSSHALFAGTLVAMWNYMGWDNASTLAGEVDSPARTYPRAMLTCVLLVAITYLLPVCASAYAGLDPRGWATGSWVVAGYAVGGKALGGAILGGAMVSAAGMLGALVLSYSRVPFAMAKDGYLPAAFARVLPRSGAPWVALLACGVAYSACLGLGFSRLVLLDVVLYGLSLVLEFAALIVLRVREPALARPFRVPGGLPALIALSVGPAALLVAAVFAAATDPDGEPATALALAASVVAAGPIVYLWRRRYARALEAAPRVAKDT